MKTLLTGMVSLPFELLDEIIYYVAQFGTLEIRTLRCVNKAFCGLVTPTAFREIVVRTTEESTQGFLELLVSTDIVKHVRAIEVIEEPGECGHGNATDSFDGLLFFLQFHTRWRPKMVKKRGLSEVLSGSIRGL
jgi:hypothetical protein